MTDKREECHTLRNSLSGLLKTEISPSEVAGATYAEVELLSQFYQRYMTTLTQMKVSIESRIDSVDSEFVKSVASQLRESNAKTPQIKSVPTVVECNRRMDLYNLAADVAIEWKLCDATNFMEEGEDPNPVFGDVIARMAKDAHCFATSLLRCSKKKKGAEVCALLQKQLDAPTSFTSVSDEVLLDVLLACSRELEDYTETLEVLEAELDSMGQSTIQAGKSAIAFLQSWRRIMSTRGSVQSAVGEERVKDSLPEDLRLKLDAIKNQCEVVDNMITRNASLSILCEISVRTIELLLAEVSARLEEMINSARLNFGFSQFLSREDVLMCTGTIASIENCNSYLGTLVQGWESLLWENGNVVGLKNVSAEYLLFNRPVSGTGTVLQLLEKVWCAAETQLSNVLSMAQTFSLRYVVGATSFDDTILTNNPTQVGCIFLLILWTRLVEGAFNQKNEGLRRDSAEVEHLGSPLRTRPVSAAVRLANITSSTSTVAPEPRPGSAAGGALFKKSSKTVSSEKKGRPPSAGAERAVYSARPRTAAKSSTNMDISKAALTTKVRCLSSTTSRKELLGAMTRVFDSMKALFILFDRNKDDVQSKKFQTLLALQYRLIRVWEDELMSLPTGADFGWKKEPRIFFDPENKVLTFGLGSRNFPLCFSPCEVPCGFVLSYQHHKVLSQLSACRSVQQSALICGPKSSGKYSTIQYFAGLTATPMRTIECKNDKLITFILDCAAVGVCGALVHFDEMEHVAQNEICQLLMQINEVQRLSVERLIHQGKEYSISQASFFVATAKSGENLHATALTAMRVCPLEESLDTFFVEGVLASRGFKDTVQSAARIVSLLDILQGVLCRKVVLEDIVFIVKRARKLLQEAGSQAIEEHHFLLMSLRSFMESLVHAKSLPFLRFTIESLFGHTVTCTDFPQLVAAATKVMKLKQLEFGESFVTSAVQLYDAVCNSRLVKVVGESGSGRTSLISVVCESASILSSSGANPIKWGLWEENVQFKGETWVVVQEEDWEKASTEIPSSCRVIVECLSANSIGQGAACITLPSVVNDDFWFPHFLKFSRVHGDRLSGAVFSALQELCEQHLVDGVHFSAYLRCEGSAPRKVVTFFRFLDALMLSNEGHSLLAAEKCFWFALSWSCCWKPSSEWDEFALHRMSEDAKPTRSIQNVCLQNDEWTPWMNVTVPSSDLLPSLSVSRALHLLQLLHRSSSHTVVILGLSGTGKSRVASNAFKGVRHSLLFNDTIRNMNIEILDDVLTHIGSEHVLHAALLTKSLSDSCKAVIAEGSSSPQLSSAFSTVYLPSDVSHDTICCMLQKSCPQDGERIASLLMDISSFLPRDSVSLGLIVSLEEIIRNAVDEVSLSQLLKAVLTSRCLPEYVDRVNEEIENRFSSSSENVLAWSGENKCDVMNREKLVSAYALRSAELTGPSACASFGKLSCYVGPPRSRVIVVGASLQLVERAVSLLSEKVGSIEVISGAGLTSRTSFASSSRIIVHVQRFGDLQAEMRTWLEQTCHILKWATSKEDVVHIASSRISDETQATMFAVSHIAACGSAEDVDLVSLCGEVDMFSSALDKIRERTRKSVEAVSSSLKFCRRVELALIQKPRMSEAEIHYAPTPDQPLRAFEGMITYNDAPKAPGRLIVRLNIDTEGTLTDVHDCAAFIESPMEQLVSVPTADGGNCKGRVDSQDTFIVYTGAYDIKVKIVRGETICLRGTISESSSNTNVGTVEMEEKVGMEVLSRSWLRWSTSDPEWSDEELLQAEELPSKEKLGKGDDEYDRTLQQISTVCRSSQALLTKHLKTQFYEFQQCFGKCLSASLLRTCMKIPFDQRSLQIREVLETAKKSFDLEIPDPLSRATEAFLLEVSEEELAKWLWDEKKLHGLPSGPNAEMAAVILRRIQEEGSSASAVDPVKMFSTWVTGHGWEQVVFVDDVSAVTADSTCIDLSPTQLSITRELQQEFISVHPQSAVLLEKGQKGARMKTHAWEDALVYFSELSTQSVSNAAVSLGEDRVRSVLQSIEDSESLLSEAASVVNAGTKTQRELDACEPQCARTSVLLTTTLRVLPSLRPEYAETFSSLLWIAKKVVKAPQKPGIGPLDNIAREFCDALIGKLQEEDRLPFCVLIAIEVSSTKFSSTRIDIVEAIRAFRRKNVADYMQMETEELVAAEAAREAWLSQTTKVDKKGKVEKPKKDRDIASFVSTKVMPRYSFLQHEQWVKVLALSEAVSAFTSLPAYFRDAEGTKVGSREEKWKEWTTNPLSAIPGYEKDNSITPAHKLLLVLALRPSKGMTGFLQFIFDVFGSDFIDPLAPDDPLSTVSNCVNTSSLQKPILLAHSSSGSSDDVLAFIHQGRGSGTRPRSADDPKDKSKKSSSPKLSQEIISMSATASLSEVEEALRRCCEGHWLVLTDAHLCESESYLKTLVDKVSALQTSNESGRVFFSCLLGGKNYSLLASSCTGRAVCNGQKGMRATMDRLYDSAIGEDVVNRLANAGSPQWHRILFIITFLASAVNERLRLSCLPQEEQKRSCDEAVAGAVDELVRLAGSTVPWDELRQSILDIITATIHDSHERAVISAYIDWLVHPDVVSKQGATGPINFPLEASYQAHKKVIAMMSATDSSELLGLHNNIQRKVQERDVSLCLEKVEKWCCSDVSQLRMAKECAREFLCCVPSWNAADVAVLEAACYESGSALLHSLLREARCLCDVSNSVRKDLEGVIALPEDAIGEKDEIVLALMLHKTPLSWREISHRNIDSMTEWIGYLTLRSNQLKLWKHHGQVPRIIALAGIKDPRSFIAAYVHDACREDGLFVECYRPKIEVIAGTQLPPPFTHEPLSAGIYLVGVQIEGARLVEGTDMICEPEDIISSWWKSTTSSVPLLRLSIEKVEVKKTAKLAAPQSASTRERALVFSRSNVIMTRSRPPSASGAVAAPVRPTRPTNMLDSPSVFFAPLFHNDGRSPDAYIADVRIQTELEHNHWMLRGVALQCGSGM